jgi:hypothetical protein
MDAPWLDIRDDAQAARQLENELSREIPRRHMLAGISPTAIARREDRDDAMFDLGDGRFAVVHLTWQRETDPQWPSTRIYNSWAAAEDRLEEDARSFAL